MDEGFTALAFLTPLMCIKNREAQVDEQVIQTEPVRLYRDICLLYNISQRFQACFGDQFLNDKPSEADNEKTTADTEAESMASVTIRQDTSITPPMTSPVIDLVSRPHSPNVHWPLPTTTITTAATTTTTLPLPPQLQQSSSESLLIKRMGELEQHIADRVDENQALESRLEKQGTRIRKLETMDWTNMIREQTTKFIESYEIDRKIEDSVKEVVSSSVKQAMRAPLRARFRISYAASGASAQPELLILAPRSFPPPPVSSTRQEDQSTGTAAPSSSKTAASAECSAGDNGLTPDKP
ncbi:hypothetical protein Tco_0051270 [Tanacetum coccineum]